MPQSGRLRPPPPWTVSAAVLGWIAASVVTVVVQVVLVSLWAQPRGVGAAAGRAGAQLAGGVEPDRLDGGIWRFTLLQAPLWLALAAAAWFIVRRGGTGLRATLGLEQRWRDVPVGLACGLATQFLLIPLVYLPLSPYIDTADVEAPARRIMALAEDAAAATVLVVAVVVVAPLVEEIYFRGLLLRALWGKMGRVWTVALSAALFGLAHLQLLQLPALVVFGLVAGTLVVATKRLAPAVWAHAAFNGVTVVALLR
ncbi:MAG: CPBP family intramembrane metalloprotease [Acidimicrobiia bacterium]|nr:CPBP family intramembrane metalloprotease [Acidimicrobiia bacterium]